MSIRVATAADLPMIASIYNAEVTGGTATWDIEPVSLEDRVAWLAAHAPDRHPVLVAEVDGRLVAWGSLSPHSLRGGWAGTVECSVYVEAGHRGGGHGRRMLDALCRRGSQLGLGVALAAVSGDNTPSLHMCVTEGFFEVGRLLKVGSKFGRTLDCVLLQRYLRERAGAVVRDGSGRTLFIHREFRGERWWILPGGTVEPGETPEQAARRELLEETGLDVRLGPLGYRVFRHGRIQRYFSAVVVRRVTEGGTGPEYGADRLAARGTYTPEWLSPEEIAGRRCLPPPVADALARGDAWPESPHTAYDEPVPPDAQRYQSPPFGR